jgi:hypothetical protein
MIRQTISCDICGAEKKQTNHWFVAHVRGGELRFTAWSADRRLRGESKHLCGQTCLYKLVDDFIAATLTGRTQPVVPEAAPELIGASEARNRCGTVDAGFSSGSGCASRDLVSVKSCTPGPAPVLPVPAPALPVPVVAFAHAPELKESHRFAAATLVHDRPNYGSRQWCAESWERERQRNAALTQRRKSS